jgi:MFS family permease
MSSRSHIPRNVLIVGFVAFFSGFGQDLITPVLPGYLALIGFSHAGVGLVDGILNGTTYFFWFISGILSDRLRNRKGLIFFGYALSSVARPLLAFAAAFLPIAALRGIDGVGKGMKDAPRDALIAESSQTRARGKAFGFSRFIDTAGSVVGPLLAGALLIFLGASLAAYRTIFLLTALPGAIALILIWFGVREPEWREGKKRKSPRAPLPFVFWMFTLTSALAWLTKPNDLLVLSRATVSGAAASWLPFIFAGFTLIYAICAYPIGVWSDRVGRLPMIAVGWAVLALAEFGFSRTLSLPPTFMLFALYGLFFAFTEGTGRALIADLVPQGARGTAYGIFYVTIGVSVVGGGYLTGALWDRYTFATAFEVAAAGSTAAAILFAFLARAKRQTPSPA